MKTLEERHAFALGVIDEMLSKPGVEDMLSQKTNEFIGYWRTRGEHTVYVKDNQAKVLSGPVAYIVGWEFPIINGNCPISSELDLIEKIRISDGHTKQ